MLTCLIWSTAFVGIKVGLRHAEPFGFAGTRFALAGLLLVPLWLWRRTSWSPLRRHWRVVLIVAAFQTVVCYGALFVGMTKIGGAQGAIVIGSAPLISAVIAHFTMRDDKLSAGKIVAIALGLAGIAMIALATKPWTAAGMSQLVGMLIVIIGIVAAKLADVAVARNRGAVDPVLLNSLQMFIGGLGLLVIAGIIEGVPSAVPPLEFFAALIYLACVSATAFSIWFTLLKHVKVSRLNMWEFTTPVFGACLSWLLLKGESPDMATVAGMACVAVSVLLSHRQAVAEAAPSRAPPGEAM
jgi:drug/metabolite transporter (DMT)-like permease